ncbi:5 hydroxytryptamine receptor 1D [Trichuris trichiura]|uniref:5 hydroxytryptamine receptor 1D n=1 Tax=Trichuris trichiura TaxID=36087 RepID=A0A077Z613_TRITR|nr:5 hydroxytryptamine receptor 1D [Trichuris trichiura]
MDCWTIAALFFLSIVCLCAILGNALIILSVLFYRGMQSTANLLLSSLATADFLIAVVLMPVALLDFAYDHRWQFDYLTCRLWTSVHVMLCTASILNLCVIGFDRYFAITSPLRYKRMQTKRLSCIILLFTWIISFVICSLQWIVPAWRTPVWFATCIYPPMLSYRICSALGSFYIPLILMLFVYLKILKVIQCRLKLIGHLTANEKSLDSFASLRYGEDASDYSTILDFSVQSSERQHSNGQRRSSEQLRKTSSCPVLFSILSFFNWTSSMSELLTPRNNRSRRSSGAKPKSRAQRSLSAVETNSDSLTKGCKSNRKKRLSSACVPSLSKRTSSTTGEDQHQRARFSSYPTMAKHDSIPRRHLFPATLLAKERKAIITICIVVSGFVICWMPFYTAHLIEPFCHGHYSHYMVDFPEAKAGYNNRDFSKGRDGRLDSFPNMVSIRKKLTSASCSIPAILTDLFLWLGYFNSVLNPLIYSFCNRDFRRCFREILLCRCRRKGNKLRVSIRRLHQPR